MRPIPVRMLIHNATLSTVEKDENLKEYDRVKASLVRVRFEPSSKIIAGANNTDIQCTAKLFVDAVNSWPQGVVINEGESVQWEGRRYIVQQVFPLYDERDLHHWEVDLADG